MGEGGAHGARIPESLEMVRDVGVRLRRLPGPALLREGEPDRPDRPESVEGPAGGSPPDGARQRSGRPSSEAPGDRRDRSVAARRPARRIRRARGARRRGRIVRLLPPRPASLGGDDGAEGGRLPEEPPGGGEADGDDHRRLACEIRIRPSEEGGAPPADGLRDPAPRGDQHAGAAGGAADAGGSSRDPAAPGPFPLVRPVQQHR